jgi:hypothetical protein
MAPMRRLLLAALLLTAALPATTSATSLVPTRSKTLTATDHLSGVRFSLTAGRLTLRLTDHRKGGTAAGPQLRGRKVRVACGEHDPLKSRDIASLARAAGVWRTTATSALFLLNRDIEQTVRWCIVERADGADIAAVDFTLGHNPAED